jgi:predicted nucleotidyltransferase
MTTLSIDKSCYQKAWQIAEKAAKVLLKNYQVSKVILFGSLLDINKFRSCSDIDIAVWGLPDNNYYLALSDLLDLTSDFSFDLVQLESAPPNLQQKILQQGYTLDNFSTTSQLNIVNLKKNIMNKYSVLIGQINQELKELQTLVKSNQRLLEKIKRTNDEDYLGTIALNLHSFYSGVERIFKQIAQTVDQSVPDQADWHRQLLRQMTASIPNIRPAFISQTTKIMLDEYCSFRHVVRNIYSINLKGDRVQQLAQQLTECYSLLQKDIEDFINIISEQDQTN